VGGARGRGPVRDAGASRGPVRRRWRTRCPRWSRASSRSSATAT
jgi:hypothetical protein